MEIDKEKFVYIKPPNDPELINVICSKLKEIGFTERMMINQDARKFGQKGDYIALIMEFSQNRQFILGKIKKDRKFTGTRLNELPLELVEYDPLIVIKIDDELQ